MKHLTPVELVDYLDGGLAPQRGAHVDACPDCRAEIAAMQSAMREAEDVSLSEPSPLFWDALSSRIRAAVDEVKPAGRPWGRIASFEWPLAGPRSIVPLGSAAALLLAVAIGVLTTRTAETPSPATARTAGAAFDTPRVAGADDAALDAVNGEVWDVLTAIASDMQIEDATAAGMTIHPSAIDRAVQGMTPDELNELGRLLQSELKHTGD